MKESNETNPRKTIYRKTAIPGVRSVWDWSEKKNDYVQRISGNRYQATVEKNQKTTSESFGSIEDARKWRERIKFDLDRLPNVMPMTFGELLEEFFKSKSDRLQITTIESYRTQARHFEKLLDVRVEDFNSQNIDRWLTDLKSPKYRLEMKLKSTRLCFGHEVTLLKNVFAYYRDYINERFVNPVTRKHDRDSVINQKRIDERKRAEKNKFISGEEIELILSAFKAQAQLKPFKHMYYVLALMQLRTGLRVGEATALCWKDIDWDTGIIEINKTVQWMRTAKRPSQISDKTKTGEDRIVRLLPSVLDELRTLRNLQNRIGGLIFSEDGETIITYRCIQHHFECAFKAANIDFRSTHILRHSFATHFLETTLNNNALKALLGHTTIKMTEKYGKTTNRVSLAGMVAFEEGLKRTEPEKT